MYNFIYHTPTRVYFGKDEEKKIGLILKEYNPKKVLIHYGQSSVIKSGLLERVKKYLEEENIPFVLLGGVKPNPTLEMVRKGIEIGKKENVDFVLAIGGGSVIDSAKDIANGLANPNDDVWDFSLGKKKPAHTTKKGCILTISAAGSEMSNSCVITNEETHEKRGYNSDFNRLDFAIMNPELTYTVSKYQTACGAVDIQMHTIERFFCKGGDTYLTDEIALAIIKSTKKAGIDSYNNPYDYAARSNMMWASSLAHNGLTQCGREFVMCVHQLEHELSGMYENIAHGAGLAALFPSYARYVYKANIERWTKFAKYLFGTEDILKAISMQEEFYKSIGMPTSLIELGVKEEDLEKLAYNASRGKTRILDGYMKLGYEEMLDIYKMAYKN
ncbi:MAG: iron-containing alcohol dehydrogenase [Bacilli bacterium]|nr:iron-containing alcohol dehydrogenase [Bacilli bacterium]